jgi:magnesium transporter
MDTHVIKAQTTDDQEQVADTMNKYGLLSMPVVDSEDRLVGIITVDDVMEVMEEEATEDFEKMAAMLPSEKPYLKTGVFTLAKNRIPWLLILMLSSTITGGILVKYENAFAAIPLLVSFIPMLMDTGGNSGSQSSTMIIRGMAIGDVEPSDILKVVWKEVRVGDRWICPGGGKLYPSDDPVSGQHDDLRDRRDQPVLYGYRCEDDRMHTADRGEGLKA